MAQIGNTPWDDELFKDRVDIIRSVKAQTASGQSRPTDQTVATDVACIFRYARGTEDVGTLSDIAVNRVSVAFPGEVDLEPGDKLVPRSPSQGSILRVGTCEYDVRFRLSTTQCSAAT